MSNPISLLGQFIAANNQKHITKKDRFVNYAQSFAIVIVVLSLVKYWLSFFVKNPGTISWNFFADDANSNSPLFSQPLYNHEEDMPTVVLAFENYNESISSGAEYIDPNNPRGDLDDQRVQEIDCWIEAVNCANNNEPYEVWIDEGCSPASFSLSGPR